MTRLDRNHILNQFTNAAYTDQDLNFFMFDQDQRHSNTRGVVGKVRANKAAFDKFAEMYESREFQKDLRKLSTMLSGRTNRKGCSEHCLLPTASLRNLEEEHCTCTLCFGVGCRPGCCRKLLLIHTFGKKSQKSSAPCTKLKIPGPTTF